MPIYQVDATEQVDLKATMLDGPPAHMHVPPPAPLPARARPLPLPRVGPLDDAVTPREGVRAAHREDDTPVQLPAGAPIHKPSVLRSALAPNFDDAWTPADGIKAPPTYEQAPPPAPAVAVDVTPPDPAAPSFPGEAPPAEARVPGPALPPTGHALEEDATLVDRPIFADHGGAISPGDSRDRAVAGGELSIPAPAGPRGLRVAPISPGDNRDRAVAGGELSIPTPAGPRGPRVEPISPGDNRDRAVAGGELSIPAPAGPRGPRVEPIAPGSNRDSMAVGGSVSVPSSPAREVRDLEDISRVSVEGIDDGQATGYFRRHEPVPPLPASPAGRESTWAKAVAPERPPRFSHPKVIAVAASLTLVVVGIIAVLTLIPAGKGQAGGGSSGGTVVVTTQPPAGCTISLDEAARGLLSQGASASLSGVRPGAHHLVVNCVGYKPFSTDIEVTKSEVTVVEAVLVKEKR